MKFTKFGKALLMSALSVGVILGVTSCVQSYTVGFLYVTGNSTSQIQRQRHHQRLQNRSQYGKPGPDQRTAGRLRRRQSGPRGPDHRRPLPLCAESRVTDPVTSGSAPPTDQLRRTQHHRVRGRRQRHPDPAGDLLHPGNQPVPHDRRQLGQLHLRARSRSLPHSSTCSLALGSGVTSCGDITAFKVDPDHGPVDPGGQRPGHLGQRCRSCPTSRFPPIPSTSCLPASYLITLSGTASGTPGSQTGDVVFPYTYNSGTGQLTVNQNSVQPINSGAGTAIISAVGECLRAG